VEAGPVHVEDLISSITSSFSYWLSICFHRFNEETEDDFKTEAVSTKRTEKREERYMWRI
jgi:hypothetical protein